MRRLFGFVILLVIVGVVLHLWKTRPAGSPTLDAAVRELGGQARDLGAEARDKLGVVGKDLQDAKITASVKTALGLNRSLRPYPIEVSTEKGVVTLRGSVDGEALRARAEAVAAEVPDVIRVTNQLQGVVPGTPHAAASPSNPERVAGAQRALQSNPNLTAFELRVREEGGRLVLHGRVRTSAEKDLAGLLASQGAVGPVENAVEVHVGTP